jgi:hypothetical protein
MLKALINFFKDLIRLYVQYIEAAIFNSKDSVYKYFLYMLASVGHVI